MTSGNEASAKARHVFVVEDDPPVRRLIAKVLTSADFSVNEFDRIEQVEEALTKRRPELVVLDLSLGGTDAMEVMRSLAGARYGGKIVLLSGHDASTLADVEAYGVRHGLGMLPYLRKPFRVAEFMERIGGLTEPVAAAGDATLLAGLQNNWLEVWYQPKIRLDTPEVCGAEALIRLNHPERGIVSPGHFLPAAGDALYGPLSDFVVRRVLGDWPILARVWPKIQVAVNVPISVLQKPDFIAGVRRHLPRDPEFPGLIIEITEDEAVNEPVGASDAATQLKLHDILISIDDFGAGFSTIERLDSLPFAELKLDRSFVIGCAGDDLKLATCDSVSGLARRYNLKSVAEGIETTEDLQALIGLGYEVGQGFYFDRPMPLASFLALRERQHQTAH